LNRETGNPESYVRDDKDQDYEPTAGSAAVRSIGRFWLIPIECQISQNLQTQHLSVFQCLLEAQREKLMYSSFWRYE
jgi:hypothetical protein